MIHDLVVAAVTLAVFVPTAAVALALHVRRYMRRMMRPKQTREMYMGPPIPPKEMP